jgi:hypothetical protein
MGIRGVARSKSRSESQQPSDHQMLDTAPLFDTTLAARPVSAEQAAPASGWARHSHANPLHCHASHSPRDASCRQALSNVLSTLEACYARLQRQARSLPVPVHMSLARLMLVTGSVSCFDAIARVLAPISASRYQSPRGLGRVGDVGGQR